MPFVYAALEAQDQPQLLSAALGLLSDVIRAVGEQIAPHCDQIVRYLFADVESHAVSRNVKPAILSVFGEIALAIGASFETYLPVVMQLLQQAATLGSGSRDTAGFEMLDYVDSLNEGILEAYSGIILGMKSAGKGTNQPTHQPGFLEPSADDSRGTTSLHAKSIWLPCGIA